MIEYEPISKRVQKDIDRSCEINLKYTKYFKRKRNISILVCLAFNIIQILIIFTDGKMSIIGISALLCAGAASGYIICLIEYGVIISMFSYLIINVGMLFILNFTGSLDTSFAIFFIVMLVGIIGMTLAGLVGIVNDSEDNEIG